MNNASPTQYCTSFSTESNTITKNKIVTAEFELPPGMTLDMVADILKEAIERYDQQYQVQPGYQSSVQGCQGYQGSPWYKKIAKPFNIQMKVSY